MGQSCVAWEPEASANPATFRASFPEITIWQGDNLPPDTFNIPLWVLSPGIPLDHPNVLKAKHCGVHITGDVTLFAQHNIKPVLAVTGSNGKSTVVTLLEKMVAAQGLRPALLGNIGTPVLDGLVNPYDCAVLELSSFQLDITTGLHPTVACILNITPDHLDRHHTMEAYTLSKQHIYDGADHVVCNADDLATHVDRPDAVFFSLTSQNKHIWHYDGEYLRYHDKQYPVSALPIHADIHYANVMAALAIMQCAGFDTDKSFKAACEFQGLPHRLVLVKEKNHVKWYDDSKATNVGATIASIDSVSKLVTGKIVIILGGLGKGASFTSLQSSLSSRGRVAILIGEAADQLSDELKDTLPCLRASSLKEAVLMSQEHAQPNDAVLLAPACASFDMFKGYADRGDQFTAMVKEII
jgi:UDP-N-acetylmuramoylalanine--D-glutamate ligase